MNLKDQLDALLDATAFDSTGTKIGAVRQVYVDDTSGKMTFATVATGIFSADAIVPLHGARLLDDELHLDHTRSEVRDSPRPDRTEDGLTPDQEFRLLEYYEVEAPSRGRAPATPAPGKSDGTGEGETDKVDKPDKAGKPGKTGKTGKADKADKASDTEKPAGRGPAEKSSTGATGADGPSNGRAGASESTPTAPDDRS